LCFGYSQGDEPSMECCASMPCTPANKTHDCCKTMVQKQDPYSQPAPKVSFQPPVEIAVATVLDFEPHEISVPLQRPLDANEHGPPQELYTVYLSLLI